MEPQHGISKGSASFLCFSTMWCFNVPLCGKTLLGLEACIAGHHLWGVISVSGCSNIPSSLTYSAEMFWVKVKTLHWKWFRTWWMCPGWVRGVGVKTAPISPDWSSSPPPNHSCCCNSSPRIEQKSVQLLVFYCLLVMCAIKRRALVVLLSITGEKSAN